MYITLYRCMVCFIESISLKNICYNYRHQKHNAVSMHPEVIGEYAFYGGHHVVCHYLENNNNI